MLKKRVQPELDWSIPPKDDPESPSNEAQTAKARNWLHAIADFIGQLIG